MPPRRHACRTGQLRGTGAARQTVRRGGCVRPPGVQQAHVIRAGAPVPSKQAVVTTALPRDGTSRAADTLYIDGRWHAAASRQSFESTNPATGAVVGRLARGDREDARNAIDAAHRAAPAWGRTSP